jgi:hypothetical protein
MRPLIPLLIIVSAAVVGFGQEPDSWRGLVIDEATPEEATKVLGSPKDEKNAVGKVIGYRNKSLRERKDLRVLHWENTQGFDDVKLYFIAGTLAIIQLEKPKDKIPAKVFIKAYQGVEFQMSRNSNYQPFYTVEAVTPRTTIEADIGNVKGSLGSGLAEIFEPPSIRKQRSDNLLTNGQIENLQGNVVLILIQSRRVDDKRGMDALK